MHKNLSYKLLASVLMVSFILTIIVTMIQLYLDFNREVSVIRGRVQVIQNSYLEPLTASWYHYDVDQARLQLKGLLRLEGVHYAEVVEHINGFERLFVAVGDKQAPSDLQEEFRIEYETFANTFGHLRVHLSFDSAYQKLWSRLVQILISNAVKTFIAAILIFIVFRKMIFKHLMHMANYTQQMDIDNLTDELTLPRKEPEVPDELSQVAAAINSMRLRLYERVQGEEDRHQSEKMETLGKMAGGVAHDFNNMLGAIKMLSDMIGKQAGDNEKIQQYIELISQAVGRSEKTIQNLLSFARKNSLDRDVFELRDLLNGAVDLFKTGIDKNIELVTTFGEEELHVKGDVSQIENAVMNILINARDALPEGGVVSLACTVLEIQENDGRFEEFKPGKFVSISIEDTGLGIPEEVQHRIFDPFFTTKETGKGTGLGLASVYGTFKSHGGHVAVSSEGGTTFTCLLPLVTETISVHAHEEQEISGTGTILLIDDEALVREPLKIMLQELGYRIFEAADGAEGLEQYQQHQADIDLIILDMIMPHMSGLECLQKLRALDKSAKVLVFSGYMGEANKETLDEMGVIDVVPKGIGRIAMSHMVDSAINKD